MICVLHYILRVLVVIKRSVVYLWIKVGSQLLVSNFLLSILKVIFSCIWETELDIVLCLSLLQFIDSFILLLSLLLFFLFLYIYTLLYCIGANLETKADVRAELISTNNIICIAIIFYVIVLISVIQCLFFRMFNTFSCNRSYHSSLHTPTLIPLLLLTAHYNAHH